MKKNYIFLFIISILIINILQLLNVYNFITFLVAYTFGFYVSKTNVFETLFRK